jgi:hypothetical protein
MKFLQGIPLGWEDEGITKEVDRSAAETGGLENWYRKLRRGWVFKNTIKCSLTWVNPPWESGTAIPVMIRLQEQVEIACFPSDVKTSLE